MSHNTTSTGLGFDFSLSKDTVKERGDPAIDDFPNNYNTQYFSTQNSNRTEPCAGSGSGTMASEQSYSTLQSASRMEGLLHAEVGDTIIELNTFGGLREGHRIALGTITPRGSSRQDNHNSVHQPHQAVLFRHGTLLSTGATPERKAAELKSILGSANARLKTGAVILPHPGERTYHEGPTSLEQAKSRARVEVDIVLHSNTCVQGGHLQGHVTVHVRKRSKSESVVAISGGKIRIIGFESISHERERYPFYQCSSPLSTITTSDGLYRETLCDSEGFSQASEGTHTFPFSMYLPLSADHGAPKGAMHTQSGVAVRYIAMVSIKVKELESNKRSIAHFYRDCEIWPRLNPSVILVPAVQPLQMSASRGLFRGGSGKVSMTASMHRLHWIAGQQCYVSVSVTNGTKKTIKSLILSLLRSTVVFKPDSSLDTLAGDHGVDPDACQTATSQKQISQSVLEMGQRSIRGHASAKGWWTGVGPGEHLDFSHFIAIPPDALSITRSRLLEVDYSLRVTLSAGTLRTADVQVTLPIRIVNFLSIDPPPSLSPLGSKQQIHPNEVVDLGEDTAERSHRVHNSRPKVSGLFSSYGTDSRLESLAEAEEETALASEDSGILDEPLDNAYDGIDSEFYGEYYQDTIDEAQQSSDEDPGDFSMYEDDADEIVQYTYPQAALDPENALRFADLYYASVQENLDQVSQQDDVDLPGNQESKPAQIPTSGSLQGFNIPKHPTRMYPELRPNARRPIILSRPHGPSSFAQRVQEKIKAAAAATNDPGLAQNVQGPSTVHQGLAESHTIFDPDDGSYFSAQDALDQTVDITEDVHNRQHASTAPAMAARPSTSRGPRDPRPSQSSSETESTASSAFSAVSNSTSSGSRLLPIPPVAHHDTLPDTGVASVPSSTRLFADADDHYTDMQDAHQPDYLHPTQDDDGVDADATYMGITRPPMAPAAGGSANSVKDRIKELEERVRAVEAGEV